MFENFFRRGTGQASRVTECSVCIELQGIEFKPNYAYLKVLRWKSDIKSKARRPICVQ